MNDARSLLNLLSSMLARRPYGPVRTIVTAVGGPALVTSLAALDQPVPTATAALLYVLVVALVSVLGGAVAGVAGSLLSFLALNIFFTPPLHTFVVGKSEDLIALVVFLGVSVTTGLLFSAVVTQKSRAERREVQTRLLNRLTSRLLSGESLDSVLRDLAESLVHLFGLTRCEITTPLTDPVVVDGAPGGEVGETYEFELASKSTPIGLLLLVLPPSQRRLDHDERTVIQGFAGQLALALESVRLSDEMKRVKFDAETSRLRAALFSGVTHDLKTPLAAITASVTSLLDGSEFSAKERYEHLETIRQEADHLNRVVSNLLDLSRIKTGALTPIKSTSGIDEVIEAVVARLQPLLLEREVSIAVKDDLPEIPMDLVQVNQVLTNLIENAVKFSPAQSPVHISAVGGPSAVRVTVADRGPGIAKEDRERIFQPFERGRIDAAGTGLGLAIAKAIVVAHGGRMWAHDGPAGGAAFTFELPVDDRQPDTQQRGSPSLSR